MRLRSMYSYKRCVYGNVGLFTMHDSVRGKAIPPRITKQQMGQKLKTNSLYCYANIVNYHGQ